MATDKCEGPTTCLTFLGIEIDTLAMELRLTQVKLARLKGEITAWQGKRSCTNVPDRPGPLLRRRDYCRIIHAHYFAEETTAGSSRPTTSQKRLLPERPGTLLRRRDYCRDRLGPLLCRRDYCRIARAHYFTEETTAGSPEPTIAGDDRPTPGPAKHCTCGCDN